MKETAANVPIIGTSPAPEPNAENPSSLIMNCGRYSSAAKKIADISSTTTADDANPRSAIMSAGIRAFAPARRSSTPKPIKASAATPNAARIAGSVHPSSDPWSSATSRASNPIDRRPPRRRRRPSVSGDSWRCTVFHVIAIARAAIGTFRKKIQRQPTVSARAPPISGPIALPNPAAPKSGRRPAPPSRRAARRRSCRGSTATSGRRRRPSAPDTRSATTARGRGRRARQAAKIVAPAKNIARRPWMSASRPPGTISTPKTRA